MTRELAFVGIYAISFGWVAMLAPLAFIWWLYRLNDQNRVGRLETIVMTLLALVSSVYFALFVPKFTSPEIGIPVAVVGDLIFIAYVIFFFRWKRHLPPSLTPAAPPSTPQDDALEQARILRETIDDPIFRDVAVDMLNEKPSLRASDVLSAWNMYKTDIPKRDDTGLIPNQSITPTAAELNTLQRVVTYCFDALGIEKKKRPVPLALSSVIDRDFPVYHELLKSPLWKLLNNFQSKAPVPIKSRFAGTFILGPPNSGKTTLIEYLATEDMKRPSASVVVIDSQSGIINELSSLKHIQNRLLLIEPGSVAINPFSMKGELGVDLITFILAALGGEGADLTAKQSSFYRPCVRLLQEVPNATFSDFVKLLQPNGINAYWQYIPRLSETVQLFFQHEFNAKPATVKDELLWRLRPITEDPVYEAMFCAPETKLDLFKELDAGKIILIDTNKQQLQPTRSALFGRMFVAFLYRAIMQRQPGKHTDVFCYIDEAHEYLQDDQIADMLDEVRKRQVAITLATQRLDKVKSTNMKSALMSTAVKYIRAGNDSDAHAMAREVGIDDANFLLHLKPRNFALFVRDVTPRAIAIEVPYFDIAAFENVPTDDLKRRMKAQYGPDPVKPRPQPASPPEEEEPTTQATDRL